MQNSLTEIERKFLIDSFPTDLPLKRQHQVYQSYLSLDPEVRIRRNVKEGQDTAYFLTIKSGSGLVREEVELDISKAHFYALAKMIEHPFISKDFRVYQLTDGLELECSLVDEGKSSEFMYAEIEFPDVDAAKGFAVLPIFKKERVVSPHQHYIGWRLICGRMAKVRKAVINQQEGTEAGASGEPGRSFLIPGRKAHLLTTRKRAAVLPTEAVRTSGTVPPDALPCPVWDRSRRRCQRLKHRTQFRHDAQGFGGGQPPTSARYIPRHCLLLSSPINED